ncbi:MAG TPA: hypothetical protein VG637_10315 [Actinomycetes bacterium]|nr:hypothetical protein [Actinomycetes bacterium]
MGRIVLFAVTLLATPMVLASAAAAADSTGFPGARPYGDVRAQSDPMSFPGARPYGEQQEDAQVDDLGFPGARPYGAS